MKLFVAQINPVVGAVWANCELIIQQIELARKAGADCVVFPQLALSGAPLYDLLFHRDFVATCEEALKKIGVATKGITAIVGSPATDGVSVYDAALLFHDGQEIGRQHDVFWCWEVAGKRIGLIVGSAAMPEMPEKADIIVHIASSPWSMGHPGVRFRSVSARAKPFGLPYLFVNVVGANDGWIFDGNSFYCNSEGEKRWQARAFAETSALVEEGVFLVETRTSMDELHRALLLGISDFYRKQKVPKAIVALSGGIDSSVTATLAVQALGAEHVEGVFCPYAFTSQESRQCVAALEKQLGLSVRTIPIDPIVEATVQQAGVGKEGLVFENIQSRIRAMLVMARSNASPSMVLGTSNKSELALGYATLYGDLMGALLPLGDLFKTEIYDVARHLGTVPGAILERVPTAELYPNQKDTDGLPEYARLDPVLRGLVMEGLSPTELTTITGMGLPIVQKLARKMYESEFKRRQGPTVLRVSSRAFGVDAVYPIVNGMGEALFL